MFAYLNINSIRNNFENLCSLLADKVDILTIAETKFDGFFPTNHYLTKPYFSNKCNNGDSKILLIENEEISNESAKATNVFNSYFESVTESLDMFNLTRETHDQVKDFVESIIQRLSHHHSIVKIKQNIKF